MNAKADTPIKIPIRTGADLDLSALTLPQIYHLHRGLHPFRLLWRDQFGPFCQSCGVEMNFERGAKDSSERATTDHIHPRSKGGSNELANYQVICRRCNTIKADVMIEGFDVQTALELPAPLYHSDTFTASLGEMCPALAALASPPHVADDKEETEPWFGRWL